MTSLPTVPNSSHRGFIRPGTGIVYGFGTPNGWDIGWWADPNLPSGGQSLDNVMQQIVASVTGLDPTLVMPRWQLEPPNLPAVGTNFAAVGVTRSTPLGFPVNIEVSAANNLGFSQQSDQEEFDTLCSFYGPNADNYAIALRSGLMVAQNREALQLLNMGLITVSGRTRVPSLVKEQYLMRVDITIQMRREVRQFYPVLYLLSVANEVITDVGYIANSPLGSPSITTQGGNVLTSNSDVVTN